MSQCVRCNTEIPATATGSLCANCACDPNSTFDFAATSKTQPQLNTHHAANQQTIDIPKTQSTNNLPVTAKAEVLNHVTVDIPLPVSIATNSKSPSPTIADNYGATIDLGTTSGNVHNLDTREVTVSPASNAIPKLIEQTVEHGWGTVANSPTRIDTSIKGDRILATQRPSAGRTITQSLDDLNIRSHRVIDPHERAQDIAEFEKLELLGQGGMGKVYAARQTSIDRTIALKVLRTEFARAPDHRAKFLAEAVVTGELEHPNIVPIYDVGATEQGELFYAMKRVRGTPWSQEILRKSLPENLSILLSVADAVAYAHSRGIVHRDLKPENIMLGDYGEVLVMDWGLALAQPSCEKANLTAPFATLGGTPSYMPPEMATGPLEAIGPPADIYLLGAMLFEIVTGKQPHYGANVMSCLHAAARNEIIATEKRGELMDIALTAMATKPENRYRDVRAFQEAIRKYQSHSESTMLSQQAECDLETAHSTQAYNDFARALFAFQEARALWQDNQAAVNGELKARLAYATSALTKGDYDLGLSLLDANDAAQQDLHQRLQIAVSEREEKQRRLRTLRNVTVFLATMIFLIVSVSLFWISRQHTALNSAFVTIQDRNEKLDEARKQANYEAAEARKAQKAEAYASYLAQIGTAADRIDSNAYLDADRLLERYAGKRGTDFRGWEWGYLKRLCHLDTGTYPLKGRGESLAISNDGKYAASITSRGDVTVWQIDTTNYTFSVLTNWNVSNAATAIGINQDGSLVVTGTRDGKIIAFRKIQTAKTYEQTAQHSLHRAAITSIRISPRGDMMATTSRDETAIVCSLPNFQVVQTLRGHFGVVTAAAFTPDQLRLATCGADGTVRVWWLNRDDAPSVYRGHRLAVSAVAVSPRGEWFASAGSDREIHVWQTDELKEFDFNKLEKQLELVRTGREEPLENKYHTPKYKLLGHMEAISTLAFGADGQTLLSGSHDNTLRRWHWQSERDAPNHVKIMRGHGGWVTTALPLGKDNYAVTIAHDERLKIWNMEAYQEYETLRGHEDAVLFASFSSQGDRIVTASRDRRVLLWDTQRGQQLKELVESNSDENNRAGPIADLREGHEFLLSSAAFFPGDQNLLATAAGDNSVRIWDITTGSQVRSLPGTGTVSITSVSPTGKWLLTGSESTDVLIWDMTDPLAKPLVLKGHQHEISAAAFASQSDEILATGDLNGRCFLWKKDEQTKEWKIVHDLQGHVKGYTVTGMRFSPDDAHIYAASRDQSVLKWKVDSGRLLSDETWKHPDAVKSFDLASDGKSALTLCATSEGNYRAYLWNTANGTSSYCDLPVEGVATGIAFNAVGTQAWIAVNTADSSSVWQWDLKSATPQRMWPNVTLRGTIWLLQPAHDSRYALAIGGNNARLLEIETGRLITPFRPHNAVHSARFSPTGDEIISSGADGDVKIWNSNEHSNEFGRVRIKITRAHEIQNRALAVNDALFLHNGTTVVTAGDDHLVKIWRLRQDSAEIISTLSEHKQRVVSLALSNDGKQLMSASQDGTAKIWKLENIKPAITPHVSLHHPAPVACATFSPDGKLAVTGCADHVARVWSLEKTESPLLELSAHTASVTSVSISPDSLRLVTGSQDGIAKLWDIRTGEELLSLKHHTAEITSVHFSPDGTNILTSSGDRTGILFRTTLPHSTDSHKQPSP